MLILIEHNGRKYSFKYLNFILLPIPIIRSKFDRIDIDFVLKKYNTQLISFYKLQFIGYK